MFSNVYEVSEGLE